MPHAPIDQIFSEKSLKKMLIFCPVSTGMFIAPCTWIFIRGILVHAEQKVVVTI